MVEVQNKLDAFEASLRKQVDDMIASKKEVLEAQKKQTQKDGEIAAQVLYDEMLQKNTYFLENKKLIEISTHMLKEKQALTLLMDESALEVFEAVLQKLHEFVTSPSYEPYMIQSFKKNLTAEMVSPVLKLSETDQYLAPIMTKEIDFPITIEIDPSIQIGGYFIYCENLGIVLDKTLDATFEEQKQQLYTNPKLTANLL